MQLPAAVRGHPMAYHLMPSCSIEYFIMQYNLYGFIAEVIEKKLNATCWARLSRESNSIVRIPLGWLFQKSQ